MFVGRFSVKVPSNFAVFEEDVEVKKKNGCVRIVGSEFNGGVNAVKIRG